ncbi:MAG: metal-dependent hydrolase [Candidatus Kerfeldbacteria bacterium]|nr:metal-dependent hydrolase [Candidatus Kerfeldbacteria bacterium]
MMLLPTHLLGGLIIGKIMGDYPAALAGALLVDLDHLVSYFKSGVWFNFKKFTKAITNRNDPWGDQRNVLHNVILGLVISASVAVFDYKFGIVFALGYLSHLVLDALDNSDYFPFFPNKKVNLKGPIKYFSIAEVMVMLGLLCWWLII